LGEDGYSYSPKNANITWDDATLDKFLASPADVVHGTKMFMNLPSSTDRQNVIAYLDTLKRQPDGDVERLARHPI
jgi:cytochrome c